MGNYHLYHVENGVNQVMTLVDSKADLTAHNQFTYDTLTGEIAPMASYVANGKTVVKVSLYILAACLDIAFAYV